MKTLIAGANLPLSANDGILTFKYLLAKGELDLSAYLLAANTGKVRGDQDMIFYGQKRNPNDAISLEIKANQSIFRINTAKIDLDIEKIKICATLDRAENFTALKQLDFRLESGGEIIASAREELTHRSESAMILAEIYRYKGAWKCRWVMQGFNHFQLKELAEHFGVEIADDSTPPPVVTPSKSHHSSSDDLSAPPPEITFNSPENLVSPPPEIILDPPSQSLASPPEVISPPSTGNSEKKITLDKQNRSISLEKKSHSFGLIKVNLNWNQTPDIKNAFSFHQQPAVDLDLGAIVRLKNGKTDVIQALGNRFGALNQPPFAELQGDDRTGENQDGEWLLINGQHWAEIKDIFVYCYIYQGAPNWSATDGVVQIYVPEQQPIVVHLTEGNNQLRLCCVARLTNDHGNIYIEREMQYFPRQSALDEHFQLGLNWKVGRKKD